MFFTVVFLKISFVTAAVLCSSSCAVQALAVINGLIELRLRERKTKKKRETGTLILEA